MRQEWYHLPDKQGITWMVKPVSLQPSPVHTGHNQSSPTWFTDQPTVPGVSLHGALISPWCLEHPLRGALISPQCLGHPLHGALNSPRCLGLPYMVHWSAHSALDIPYIVHWSAHGAWGFPHMVQWSAHSALDIPYMVLNSKTMFHWVQMVMWHLV